MRLTPILLSLVLALFGLAMFTYVLVTSVQRRRRDLAVLKTLGFSRSQIFAVTNWQSNALAVVALLIGLPLGVVVGWRAWAVFADALGVSTSAGTSLLPGGAGGDSGHACASQRGRGGRAWLGCQPSQASGRAAIGIGGAAENNVTQVS